MNYSVRQKRIVEELKEQDLSPSHQLDHAERVAKYASELAEIYGGNKEVVAAAALLHDLGRSDLSKRGGESAEEGARLAEPILDKVGYNREEKGLILQCIAEHDRPELHSNLLEARILKDADYLDGFGARGILRSLVYAGETGGGVEEAIERLRVKSRRRLEGMEFVESKRLGWRMYRLVEVFLAELERELAVADARYKGKLVVIEGISGSGKDTQADLLVEWLEKEGRVAVKVNHPTGEFKEKIWRGWKGLADDRQSELFLILADRARMVRQVIKPALREGKIVVSTRSSVSAQVYQVIEGVDESFHRFCFGFEPVADLIVYLDISADEALARADRRVAEGDEKDRGFFGTRQGEMRRRFEEVLKQYPGVVKIKAEGKRERVFEQVKRAVETLLG